MQLMFESRMDIGKLEGKLRWVQQKAKVREQPVLLPSNAGDGAGASIYGSVLHDGGKYRMWYQGWPHDWTGLNSSIVCYAESDDGIEWTKPNLKLDDRFAGEHNVTDLGMHAPSVFIDPDAPASHRYRATGHGCVGNSGSRQDIEGSGYFTLHSADGLHWELDTKTPTWPNGDVITSMYHPVQKRGMVALKQNVRSNGIKRRALAHAYLDGGRYTNWQWSILPDQFDDLTAMTRGFVSADYYGMAMQHAEEATIGFIWQFRHAQPRTRSDYGDGPGVFGVVDISLAYQHDARSLWMRPRGQVDFINNMDIPWRPHSCVYTASSPVTVGDEDRLYLSASFAHGWYIDPRWHLIEDAKAKLMDRGICQIGYASWPRHRLFGYRAEPTGSIDLNLGKHDKPIKLSLNVEPHNAEGSATVAIEGQSRHTHAMCKPINDNGIQTDVQWQDGTVIQPNPDGIIVANIALNEATLWAWKIVPA